MASCLGIADINEDQIARLQELEEALDTPILAVEPRCKWADLDEERVRMLKEAEEEMGVILLAYEPQ